jgi:predicted RNA binding protein YcfA (HicA-like mRNA interferase family)
VARTPRWTAKEAEAALVSKGFSLLRVKGGHRIYRKGNARITVPFHAGEILHPKIIKQVMRAIEESAGSRK